MAISRERLNGTLTFLLGLSLRVTVARVAPYMALFQQGRSGPGARLMGSCPFGGSFMSCSWLYEDVRPGILVRIWNCSQQGFGRDECLNKRIPWQTSSNGLELCRVWLERFHVFSTPRSLLAAAYG